MYTQVYNVYIQVNYLYMDIDTLIAINAEEQKITEEGAYDTPYQLSESDKLAINGPF